MVVERSNVHESRETTLKWETWAVALTNKDIRPLKKIFMNQNRWMDTLDGTHASEKMCVDAFRKSQNNEGYYRCTIYEK